MIHQFLERERIDHKLEKIFTYPLSIIHAPTGYGKTTAVRLFLAKHPCNAAALSVAECGDAPAALWQAMVGRMAAAGWDTAGELGRIGYPDGKEKTAALLACFERAGWPAPFLLVLDDFQQFRDPGLFHLFKKLAELQPAGFHLVLLTRDLSFLDAAALYQKGLCFTLTEKALRFTAQEVLQYSRLTGAALTEAQAQAVSSYADGWIGMISLILDGMSRGMPMQKNDTVEEFFEQNIYPALSAGAREALVQLSALEEFPLPLAVSVLQTDAQSGVLEELLHNGAVIVYDEFHKTYHLQNLMKDFLEEKESWRQPDLTRSRRRAGEWYLRHGDPASAYHYLALAGEQRSILADLDRPAREMIPSGQFEQVLHILAQVEEDTMLAYPWACLRYVYVLALCGAKGAWPQGWDLLLKMDELLQQERWEPRERSLLRGEAELLWMLLCFNRLEEMLQHGRQAKKYLQASPSQIILRGHALTFGSPELLYLFHSERGRLGEKVRLLSQELPLLSENLDGCGLGADSVLLAEYALETGNLEQAELYAYKGIYKARTAGQRDLLLCAHFTLCRLALFAGNTQECARLLDGLQAELAPGQTPLLQTAFQLCQAYLACCRKEPQAAAAWISAGDRSGQTFYLQAASFYDVVRGKVLLAGDPLQLEAFCETAVPHFQRFDLQLGLLHNLLHMAAAKRGLEDAAGAQALLEKALTLAFADHLVFPFAEDGEVLLPLLETALAQGRWAAEDAGRNVFEQTRGEYLAELLKLAHRYSGARTPQEQRTILTARELEILTLLARGYKHAEISKQLFISVTTVRFHIQNIYQKLNVNNKVLAIQEAKKAGLI